MPGCIAIVASSDFVIVGGGSWGGSGGRATRLPATPSPSLDPKLDVSYKPALVVPPLARPPSDPFGQGRR